MVIPIKVRQPPNMSPQETFRISPEELKKMAQQHSALIDIRGKVISYALVVEERLDSLLALLLMGQSPPARNQFKTLLLDKEFFTFQAKWQVLRDITKLEQFNFESDKLRRDFLEDVKQIIRQRNWFAHGQVVFEGTNPCLHYTDGGKTKSQRLDAEYFKELALRINKTLVMFAHISRAVSDFHNRE